MKWKEGEGKEEIAVPEFFWWEWENPQYTSVKIDEYLPNARQTHYCYSNLLGLAEYCQKNDVATTVVCLGQG
jgi:hypothetical protein